MNVEKLLDDIRDELNGRVPLEEKRMFGGTGFLWRGNLVCAASKRGLLVRLSDDDFSELLGVDGAEPMKMGARVSKNWMRIPPEAVTRKPKVRKWLSYAVAFVETLPSK